MLNSLNEVSEETQKQLSNEDPQHVITRKDFATSQTNRDQYFTKLKDPFNFLDKISNQLTDELKQKGKKAIFDECKNSFISKFEEFGKKLDSCCASLRLSSMANAAKERVCDEFRKYYNFLQTADKYFKWLNAASFIDAARSSILGLIDTFKSYIDINSSNTETIAEALMEMKFLADNIPFLKKIYFLTK